MVTKKNTKTSAGTFDLLIPDNLQEIFSDGISEAMIGYPTSKILFHTTTAASTAEGAPEQRQGVVRLTMNTAVLMEMCRNLLAGALQNKGQFPLISAQYDAQFQQVLEGITVTQLIPGATVPPVVK